MNKEFFKRELRAVGANGLVWLFVVQLLPQVRPVSQAEMDLANTVMVGGALLCMGLIVWGSRK